MPKLDWTLSAFGDEISADLAEQLETLTKYGIHHLEIRSVWGKNILELSDQELQRVKEGLRDYGCSISAIGSPIGKVEIEANFQEHLKQFERALAVAEFFETKYIRMFSFFIKPGEHSRYRSRVLDQVGTLTQLAEKRAIILLHENEKEIYGDTAERCVDILQSINSPHLRATFDSANFIQVGEEPYPKAYELLKPWIEYVHVKDALYATGEVRPAGEGDARFGRFIENLVGDGYEGFLSIEPHLDNSGPGGGAGRFAEAYEALMKLIRAQPNVRVS